MLYLLEFGLSLPKGHKVAKGLFAWLSQQSVRLSPMVVGELQALHDHYQYLNERISLQDEKIRSYTEASEQCALLQTIPGIGVNVASQLAVEVGDAQQFKNGRHMAAWLGLVPRQYSTGGKPKLLGISKRGNKQLRCVIVHGARAILSRITSGKGPLYDWLRKLRETKPFNKVCIALANKMVRMAYAVLSTGQPYKA